MGSLVTVSLNVYCWVWWWKTCKNRSTFAEVMCKNQVSCFFTYLVVQTKTTRVNTVRETALPCPSMGATGRISHTDLRYLALNVWPGTNEDNAWNLSRTVNLNRSASFFFLYFLSNFVKPPVFILTCTWMNLHQNSNRTAHMCWSMYLPYLEKRAIFQSVHKFITAVTWALKSHGKLR